MAQTLRDTILGFDDLRTREVNVPEWGMAVHVAMLTAGERDRLEYAIQEAKPRRSDIRALVAAYCLCEPDGRRLFGPADVEALSRKSGSALDRIFSAALAFNRMTARDVEDLEGNSGAVPSDASPSA